MVPFTPRDTFLTGNFKHARAVVNVFMHFKLCLMSPLMTAGRGVLHLSANQLSHIYTRPGKGKTQENYDNCF